MAPWRWAKNRSGDFWDHVASDAYLDRRGVYDSLTVYVVAVVCRDVPVVGLSVLAVMAGTVAVILAAGVLAVLELAALL